jgi:F-type H+-transporting ATPase subunit a
MTVYSSSVPVVYQAAILCAGLLLFAAFLARRKLVSGEGVIPDEGFSLRNIFEVLTEYLYDMAESIMGEHARTYFPICAAIFFFILIGNVMGLVPGLGGPTSDVNTAAAWAIISFAVYNFIGIKTHGWKYVYQFMGPALWQPEIGGQTWHVRVLAPLFVPLELILHVARIVTLTVRLVANMFADHTVVGVWIGLVPIAIPALFMGLGLLVAFLQAFVFALLTMIYIGSALEEAH